MSDPVTSIDPAYEAVLRKMVGDLEQAPDAHERWAAANALQGQADSAIGELLDTVTVLRAERDAAAAGRRAVCDCGTSASLEVDEDGLCLSCGADVIVCADLHSAELVSMLRTEKDALGVNYADLHPRINVVRDRAEAAEVERDALRAEVARLRRGIADLADFEPADWSADQVEAVRQALLAALRGEA
jgi:hypothetical protein